MGMFSQNEIMLMILVVTVLLVFIIILTILDIKEYRKNKDMNYNLKKDEETVIEENVVDIKPLHEDDMIEVLEIKEEPKEEIMPLEEVVISNEIEEQNNISELENDIVIQEPVMEEYTPKKISLDEELTKIEETMVDTNEKLENTITSFEEEQERTAIISLDELLQNTDNLYSKNEISQYDDGNVPISVEEAIQTINGETTATIEKEEEIPQVLKETLKEEKELYTHKEEIPYISSIYGIENDLTFENTANYEKMDRAKTNEFMQKLKEMSENK